MIATIVSLHSSTLLAGSIGVCLVTSGLALAFRAIAAENAQSRTLWAALTALMAGAGVWMTHFTAMLAFRPDLLFGFDPLMTKLSGAMAIVLVGGPIGLSARYDGWRAALCGGAAGLGIAAMHAIGIGAIIGCSVDQSLGHGAISTGIGAVLAATAIGLSSRGNPLLAGPVLAGAVAVIHFTSMAGLSLTPDATSFGHTAIERSVMGYLVFALGLVVVFTGAAFLATQMNVRREMTRRAATLDRALANMSNGLVMFGRDERIMVFNDRARDLFGLEPGEIALGMRWSELVANAGRRNGWSEAQIEESLAHHAHLIAAREPSRYERETGAGRVLSISFSPFEGGYVVTHDDITEIRRQERRVRHLAERDTLTDLYNRRAYEAALEANLTDGAPFTLLTFDLDRFKAINDALGHAAGDAVLKRVATILRDAAREADMAARLGGDEFALILPGATGEQAARVAERIVARVAEPMEIDGTIIEIGVSAGLAAAQPGTDLETLLQHCDYALYSAKSAGRGQVMAFDETMVEAVEERRTIERALRGALDRDEFSLNFQPLHRSRAPNPLFGFECLLRWTHPELGAVRPDVFIPIAEEAGLMVRIGDWVLREACREAARWPGHIHIAVNISPVQMADGGFIDRVKWILEETGIAPTRLEVELTETALVRDVAMIAGTLAKLRQMGVKVSMDDFGTGYSSLTHLCSFELDRIKVDRSFVARALEDQGAMAVMEAVVGMGRTLGVPVIGEGVETEEQLAMLARIGCEGAQGYLLGRPMSASDALALTTHEDVSPGAKAA